MYLFYLVTVLIIFCNADLLRDILYRAHQLGMADGDFVFITMELFPSDWLGHYMVFLRGKCACSTLAQTNPGFYVSAVKVF